MGRHRLCALPGLRKAGYTFPLPKIVTCSVVQYCHLRRDGDCDYFQPRSCLRSGLRMQPYREELGSNHRRGNVH